MTQAEFQAEVLRRFDAIDARFDAIDKEFEALATDINDQFTEFQRREDDAHTAIGERLDAISTRQPAPSE